MAESASVPGWHRKFRWLMTGLAGFGIVWLLWRLDWNLLVTSFTHARVIPILLAAVVSFAILGCKSWCWNILLSPWWPHGKLRMYKVTLLTFAASIILPLRAGEVLRVLLLRRQSPLTVGQCVAAALIEKVVDVLCVAFFALAVVVLPSSAAGAQRIRLTNLWVYVPYAAGGLLVAGLCVVVLWMRSERIRTWVQQFLSSAASVATPKKITAASSVLLLGWLIDTAAIALVLDAVSIPVTGATIVFTLVGINLAVALPSTPGQVGVMQLSAVAALHLCGVAPASALAFAILYQAQQVFPLLLVALLLDPAVMAGRWPTVVRDPSH
jgi:glycosyltransferase 2 family protein